MMEYSFTKSVEEDFDIIANGKLEYPTMLQKFWDEILKKCIEEAGEKAEKVVELVGKKCPECSEELIYKFSKAGKFIGCS
jgi:DNA topoisomerase-1